MIADQVLLLQRASLESATCSHGKENFGEKGVGEGEQH